MLHFYPHRNMRVFKSVHVCTIYNCKHWTLVTDFSNGNQSLTGSTEFACADLHAKRDTERVTCVERKYTVVYQSSSTSNIT